MLFIFYIILLLSTLTESYELNRLNCNSCKWFLEGKNVDLGLCKMFPEKINGKTINNFAAHCRNNEDMCGPSGIFYEDNYVKSFSKDEYKFYSQYMNKIAKKNIIKIK